MFEKSRRKIVASIMSILLILWTGTLCVIYASSYFEVSKRNREMLKQYVASYSLEPLPANGMLMEGNPEPGMKKNPRLENAPVFKLSTFYSVAISYEGEILVVNNNKAVIYENNELEQIAFEIVESGKNTGVKNNLVYRMADKGGYILIAFMDNTIVQESMTTLFRYTLIFGCIAIIFLFFLAVYLAHRIVKPLEESYQKQKQFISDAGHELKTPVSVVSANAELLSREIGENPWLANISYENERMGKLVGQLLELARTENVSPQIERLDFSRLVIGGVLPFESVAFEKGLVLNIEITNDIFVNGSSDQLSQLVSILLDNAIRHGENGKEVVVRLTEKRGMAHLTVINDGEAIPADKIEQLFERFYRVDEARNGETRHYGLGLAIAKAIVTAHHGKIEVSCGNGKVYFTARIPNKR